MATPAPLNPPIAGSTLARIVVECLCDHQRCMYSIDYLSNTVVVGKFVEVSNFEAQWEANLLAKLRACLAADCTLTSISAIAISDNSVQPVVSPQGLAGTVAGNHLPIEMAITIAKQSSIRGRSGRGWLQLPGIPISFTTPATDPNILNATGLAATNTLCVELLHAVVSGAYTWTPVVSSRPPKGFPNYTRAAPLNGIVPRLLLGTVRRRKEGRGI